MPRSVFRSETEEHAPPSDGNWLTGRFSGSLQDGERAYEFFADLRLDEALAWARSRANRVLIRYGEEPDVHYSAGADHPRDLRRWPPDALPPLGRRRHPDHRWRDRSDADAPIAWRATPISFRPTPTACRSPS